jgi:undecaprenyl-diphosphatase
LFFGWLSEEVFEGETRTFDESIRNLVHGFASPPVTALMKFFSFLGSPLFLVILGAIVIASLLYLKHKRALVLFLISVAGELALDLALKAFFGRVRPAAFFDYPLPSSYSFPSGHAFGSLCFYGILAWLTAARLPNKAAELAIGILAALLIFFIGFSRIYLGVHFPSDVLAGYAAGLFWIGVIALTDTHLRGKNANQKNI